MRQGIKGEGETTINRQPVIPNYEVPRYQCLAFISSQSVFFIRIIPVITSSLAGI